MKKFLCFMFAIAFALACFAAGVSASSGGLIYSDCGDHCEVSGYDGTPSDVLDIPKTAYIGGRTLPITAVCPFAFSNCGKITGAVIPDGVINIGDSAFSCCTELKSVSLPENILR